MNVFHAFGFLLFEKWKLETLQLLHTLTTVKQPW
jgi:hypothetical protein